MMMIRFAALRPARARGFGGNIAVVTVSVVQAEWGMPQGAMMIRASRGPRCSDSKAAEIYQQNILCE